ncbi:hypothetical protein [Niveispirillum sp. SYP-B3756]|uniref:hypothetical protein n=1 Tax=Niveispirillum sp. SYP-B3756 TaxID=2662178 RepID=UPI001B3BA903|nr:hypothetical protein [Niveispirillum sp. SYP-B3756]
MTDRLLNLIGQESEGPPPAPAQAVVAALLAQGGNNVAAILFYGSNLRSGDVEGVLDFYVLVDSLTVWHRSRPLALATRLLPPTVEFWEVPWQGHVLRAKVAVLRADQFASATRPASLDTTIWARFAQPVILAHARDAAARHATLSALAGAVATAAHWAVRLGPESGTARQFWEALFRATYAAELRVEKGERGVSLVEHAEARYAALLSPALTLGGIGFQVEGDAITPSLSAGERQKGRAAWGRRRFAGKLLNIARLVKAAFTFKGGVDYIVWKIHRHSGVRLELTPWQRRHPILSAPLILYRLRRLGAIR